MHEALKVAISVCKTMLRNGYDAHVINAPLQQQLLEKGGSPAVDIACEPDVDVLSKLFPALSRVDEGPLLAQLVEEGVTLRFYPLVVEDASHPELSLMRISPTMVARLDPKDRQNLSLAGCVVPENTDIYAGFAEVKSGPIRLCGLPDETLRRNYLLAIRALRFAANFDLPIEANTWLAIVRSASRVLDYVPAADIMNEWRQVPPTAMYRFVRLLYDAQILQGLIPEVASLNAIRERNHNTGEEESIFEHTLACMKFYPEKDFHYDWLGTLSMLFHDVGKLFTGENIDGEMSFYQHHRVGAKVTRKILRRLHFTTEDIDLLCHLVRYHMRFHFMMTDRGIRRFKALDEYPRLIAMARADVQARDGNFTSFNHNMKYLERAETPEQMLEPLLNGNEIMNETHLAPGPLVGDIREALLQAQIAGEVTDTASAIRFVRAYATRLSC